VSWWLVWWVWLAISVTLGILEILLPVNVFLGFSGGAFGTAILVALGLDLGLGGTLLLFAVISGVGILVLRLSLGGHRGTARIVERDINEPIPPRREPPREP
jgi:membrane protein implicated in regulation of membrane protease activity